jgi:hypothetical protein
MLCAAFVAKAAATDPLRDYVVHEWGTFTCVQGADGIQIIWNPLVAPELPKFVYDRVHAHIPNIRVAGKVGTASRQRMETPVLYFYSAEARTVDVSVRFPQGAVTEWYPLETAADVREPEDRKVNGEDAPILHWKQLQILGSRDNAPKLPFDDTGSHYYAARKTDASPVCVDSNHKTEIEKFLFYRGLANFRAPLTARVQSGDGASVSLSNSGLEALPHLFLCQVRPDGLVTWMPVGKLNPGETRELNLGNASNTGADSLATALRSALAEEGLYEKEAAAMVKTWQDSWLQEPGLRVLYALPRAWTDRTLPLAITPAPKSVERVMVGRAEIITPVVEAALLANVDKYLVASAADRPQIISQTRALGLGRFIGPAISRLLDVQHHDSAFYAAALNLAAEVAGGTAGYVAHPPTASVEGTRP